MGEGNVRGYLQAVRSILLENLQQELAAAWLSGSVVLGGFEAARSDIDLICISRRRLSREEKSLVAKTLSHEALPCPAVCLDLVVLLQDVAKRPVCPLPYELGLATGSQWGLEVEMQGEETELLIDLEICRRHGRPLFGIPPSQMIGPVPEAWIADALNLIVKWHRRHIHHPFHDPLGHNAVLNACRATRWFADQRFVSKSEAGRWALLQDPSQRVIRHALAALEGSRKEPLQKGQVVSFLELAAVECSEPPV